VARLELPDFQSIRPLRFTPDGSRVVFWAEDQRTVSIVELRELRRKLADMDLDWDWPAARRGRGSAAPAAAGHHAR
jgi:hypothetical protein